MTDTIDTDDIHGVQIYKLGERPFEPDRCWRIETHFEHGIGMRTLFASRLTKSEAAELYDEIERLRGEVEAISVDVLRGEDL